MLKRQKRISLSGGVLYGHMDESIWISPEVHAFKTECREMRREQGSLVRRHPDEWEGRTGYQTIMEWLSEKEKFRSSVHRKNELKKVRELV